jgi:TetR/AcrR family transcriptional repressor of nem operon
MRVSRAQAEQNRERIVEVAGELFRAKGFDGIGVADLMQAAGLTHGGFYGNFASKEALEAEATSRAAELTCVALRQVAAEADDPLAAVVGFYLSPEHRDHPETGCTIAALAPEAARGGPALRTAFETAIRAYLDLLAPLMPGASEEVRLAKSLATCSTMVGALLLARTVNDPKLSDAILQSAADTVLGRA